MQVTVAGGGVLTYWVYERRSYDKDTGLPAGIFGTDGTPRLVLITCGGTFDKSNGKRRTQRRRLRQPHLILLRGEPIIGHPQLMPRASGTTVVLVRTANAFPDPGLALLLSSEKPQTGD